nr:ATP synthase 8 [Physella acuta]CAH2593478.1 ATP synthase 8 [Physella acuta]CAH2593666.1 ATP synthase 8 [Physella acuta]CAH2593725.1 ATP synthase 8 [Physella acuta]CAH2594062.1 ATP synthase 8 [Physella acuta]
MPQLAPAYVVAVFLFVNVILIIISVSIYFSCVRKINHKVY